MATKVETRLVDDLDGQEADETVQFGIDGETYEIDLSIKHAEELRDALTLYVDNARKASSGRKRRREPVEGATPAERRDPEAPKIREWAREHGIEVPERGRIPEDVKERYRANETAPIPVHVSGTDSEADVGHVEAVPARVEHLPPADEPDGDFEWDDDSESQ